MSITSEISCPSCHAVSPESANFCSQCGKKLKEPSLSTSVGKQVIVYLVSFFLAPFGLGYALKYLKQSDPKARGIGIAAIILTVIAITLMILIAKIFFGSFYQSINTLTF